MLSTAKAGEGHALVVVVDDQATGRRILEQVIGGIGRNVEILCFADAGAALDLIAARTPDLVVTDYVMPKMDGVTFLRRLRALPGCADIPVIVVTILDDQQVRNDALDAGATDFLNRPVNEHECRARCRNLLLMREQAKLIADRARLLEDRIAQATEVVRARERETLLRLARAGEYRDTATGNHVLRIARYARLLAEAMGLDAATCHDLELAAPMHDIGKVGIPDHILLKPGRLTAPEWEVMRRHTLIGHDILRDSPSPFLRLGAEIALCHHERWDGTGYPRGLAGEDIPLTARIVTVVDVYDALVTVRPYKPAWTPEDALEAIRAEAGCGLDPDCVAAFVAVFDQVRAIGASLPDDTGVADAASDEG
jgi:two-component system response regulator RpfG